MVVFPSVCNVPNFASGLFFDLFVHRVNRSGNLLCMLRANKSWGVIRGLEGWHRKIDLDSVPRTHSHYWW